MRLRGGGTATETVWGIGLELVTLGNMILSFTLLGRTLGPELYGGYASVYATIGPMLTLAGGGVMLALLQHAVRDREPLAATARSCLAMSSGLGLVLVAIGAVAVPHIVSTLSFLAIVSILVVEFVTAPVVLVAATTVQAGTSFIGAARLRMLLVGMRIVALLALFFTGRLTVAAYAVCQLAGTSVLALLALRSVGRRYGFAFRPGRVHLAHFRTNLSYSTAISAGAVQNDGDKSVLAAHQYTVDTGLYAAALRIAFLGMVPVWSVIDVTHKKFLENDGSPGYHLRLTTKLTALSSLYAIALGAGVFVVAPVLPLVLGDEFEGSVEILRWLSPLLLLRVLGTFPLNGIMGLGRTGLRTVITVVVAAVALVIYLVLVPAHGWRGAVGGSILADAILAVVAWIVLVVEQRRFDRRPPEDAGGSAVASDEEPAVAG